MVKKVPAKLVKKSKRHGIPRDELVSSWGVGGRRAESWGRRAVSWGRLGEDEGGECAL